MKRRAVATEATLPFVSGLYVTRRWTSPERDPFEQVQWERRPSVISDVAGGEIFRMDSVEVPRRWSQLSTDIAASKYLLVHQLGAFNSPVFFNVGLFHLRAGQERSADIQVRLGLRHQARAHLRRGDRLRAHVLPRGP